MNEQVKDKGINSSKLAEYYAKEKDELNTLFYLEQSLDKGELKLEEVLQNDLWHFVADNYYFEKIIERRRNDKAYMLDQECKENIKVLDLTRKTYLSFKIYPEISKFINLEKLILDNYDFLKKFPDEFLSLEKIKNISIKKCRYVVTEGLEKLPRLESLNCSGINFFGNWSQTGFESRLKYIFQCKELKELFLDGCELDELPEDIGKLENLEVLNLNRNRLRILPKAITWLKKLKKLSIANTIIKNIDEEILFMPQLKELYVGNMSIAKEQKDFLDKLFQKKLEECPEFKTDYFGDVQVQLQFSPGIQLQLERLKVTKAKSIPEAGFEMKVQRKETREIPVELAQILWGYDLEKLKFRITNEGKKFYGIDENEEAKVTITADKYESASEYREGMPYLCFGKITGVKSMTKLLFELTDWYVYDPRVVVIMPNEPLFGDGSLEKFSQFLSYLERVK